MNFDNNFNLQRNSNTLILDDNDLLDDEWLYTSESFNRTDTFRRKVKNEGDSTRNSILEWLATDDDKINDVATDNSSIDLEDISRNKSKTDSINLFDDNNIFNNSDSLFEDDLDISNLNSRFMSNFKLVSQDDFEDPEIEESLTKDNINPEFHRCESPNTEINLIDSNKIGNNEVVNVNDNDSDSNMTIINTAFRNKSESLNEVEKNTEIVNIEKIEIEKNNENKINENKINENKINENKINENKINENKINENKINENKINENKINENKINENKINENKITENKITENKINENETTNNETTKTEIKEYKTNENKSNEDKTNENISSELIENSKSNLLKKSELAQKRFLAKVEEAKKTLENLKPRKGSLSSSETEYNIKTPKLEEKENHSNINKDKTFNKKKIERRSYYYYADTGSDDEKEDKNSSTNINSRKASIDSSNNSHSADSLKKTFNYFNSGGADSPFYSDNIYNTNESNFISLPPAQLGNKYGEDFEDYPRKPPAPSIQNSGTHMTNFIDHSNFDRQIYHTDIETESNSSFHSDIHQPEYYYNQSYSNYRHSKSSLGYYSTSPRSPILKPNNLFTPSSPNMKPNTSFIPTSPSLKPNTSFIPTSPSLKPNTSFIPTSPTLKPNSSFIPTSPSLKPSNSYRPSSPTVGKFSTSLYNKQKTAIASPRIGYSTPSSPTPYSKSYEARTYDPVAPTYSIKDLINNKTPQVLNHSNSINSVSSISSSSTYKPTNSFSRKASLEQTPQLKNYLNKMATTQRSKSPSVLSTSSTSSSKYSSGRKTPNSRLGSHYAESTASSTSSTSKIYSKYKSASSTSSIPKKGSGIPSSVDRKATTVSAPSISMDNNKSKLSSAYGKSLYSGSIPSSNSKISYSNGVYSGRLSKTPTPSNYNRNSSESRIPSPSPYSKRSITPY